MAELPKSRNLRAIKENLVDKTKESTQPVNNIRIIVLTPEAAFTFEQGSTTINYAEKDQASLSVKRVDYPLNMLTETLKQAYDRATNPIDID